MSDAVMANEGSDEFKAPNKKRSARKRRSSQTKAMEVEEGSSEATSDAQVSGVKRPHFAPLKPADAASGLAGVRETRRIAVPAHRYTPIKEHWLEVYTPLVEKLGLQVRFNLRSRHVELRTCPQTTDVAALQRGADFVQAVVYGFDVADALALIRLQDLFLEAFEVKDVKPLKGDHLARAIGRIAGKHGKTKFTIENETRTRIVLANEKIYLLGSFSNIKHARTAICNLILGAPPSKVYGQLRSSGIARYRGAE